MLSSKYNAVGLSHKKGTPQVIFFAYQSFGKKGKKKEEKRSPQDSIAASALSVTFQNPLEKVTFKLAGNHRQHFKELLKIVHNSNLLNVCFSGFHRTETSGKQPKSENFCSRRLQVEYQSFHKLHAEQVTTISL